MAGRELGDSRDGLRSDRTFFVQVKNPEILMVLTTAKMLSPMFEKILKRAGFESRLTRGRIFRRDMDVTNFSELRGDPMLRGDFDVGHRFDLEPNVVTLEFVACGFDGAGERQRLISAADVSDDADACLGGGGRVGTGLASPVDDIGGSCCQRFFVLCCVVLCV